MKSFRKRISISLLLIITFFGLGYAQQVDENTAREIGLAFLAGSTEATSARTSSELELVYTARSKPASTTTNGRSSVSTYFYIFNTSKKDGFVIVSGDESVLPILGYSNEGSFDSQNIPQNVAKWLEGYKKEIRFVLEKKIEATAEIQEEWKNLRNGKNKNGKSKKTKAVSPLIQTKWNQSPFYNALSPFDNSSNERTVTGCVATAMAQVMKYWNYPAVGSGFHSYNHMRYGTLSANFGATQYQWNLMPNQVTSANNAVATLMYHCGVSVDMDYDIPGNGGSGAYVISSHTAVPHCAEYALKTYFGYKNTLAGIERDNNYSETQWINLLKAELDAGRPIIYAGFGGGSGHCFISDGYDTNNFFHFNWGWGGLHDAYFSINSLNPQGVGIGGGTGGYNSGHQAVIGIQPPPNSVTYNLEITEDVAPSSSTIGYGDAFTISCNITNEGTNTFTGDYCAAMFDDNNNFIDYVQIKTGVSLPAGNTYINDLVFSNDGDFGFLPGNYSVFIFYRPTGGEWKQIQSTSIFVGDHTSIGIVHSSGIEMNSVMTLTPATTWKKGQPASVTLNVTNVGATTFTGTYGLGLFNMDGSLAQTIALKPENTGLPSGYTYASPYLTFSTSSVTVEPGTYLLALQHNPNNTGWQLTGSTNFQNPIKVIVEAPPLMPDAYESNNSPQTAKTLNITFANDFATKNTSGTNLHVGSDYDYFKINLPDGFEYAINARLQDSNNSNDGNTYTVDALFSYSTNGTEWSDAYDDTMPSEITVPEGSDEIYFHVAPYFSGETGTYLLEIELQRETITGIEETTTNDQIGIYPNPARQSVIVNMVDFNGSVSEINLTNMQGQVVASYHNAGGTKKEIPLADITDGLYIVQLKTTKGLIAKKLMVER